MRKLWTALALAVLMIAACDEKTDQLPAARIAPTVDKVPAEAPVSEEVPEEEASAPSKGVGAAGCASPACEEACKAHEQPECAEAFAAGCFTDTPPENARCEGFAASPKRVEEGVDGAPPAARPDAVVKPTSHRGKAIQGMEDDDNQGAKATPIGD